MDQTTQPNKTNDVPMQDAALDIWDKKYRLKNASGENVDTDIHGTFERVAKAIAQVEPKSKQKKYYREFLWALENGAIPAGRIIANAGAEDLKPATSTINCTVSGRIDDCMTDILQKHMEAGLTLKAGCGIGYEFSTLRPRGAYVSGSGATTSGPLSFMDIFDKMCFTISSAGGRRGAQMATLDISHPDVEDFITAKREDGRLRQFNLSLLINEEFIEAVKNNRSWQLYFPLTESEISNNRISLDNPEEVVWKRADQFDASKQTYVRNEEGEYACKIYKTLSAGKLWDKIMQSTYDFAEPGFILIDRVNKLNNNWFCETIRATNPCGEQPLPPYGSCLLGSINLTRFVENPFAENALFNWDKYRKVIAVFTRMLDNIVELHGLALSQQQQEILSKRRHGMGFLGLGSCLTMLKIAYGSPASVAFTEQVSRELALVGWREALALAKEKGPAPILEESFEITDQLLQQKPALEKDGYKIGDQVKGSVLHARYSEYMSCIAEEDLELMNQLAETGARFTHHSSIAPTGTISLSIANNASNGIEPSFAHCYSRNIIREGKKSKEQVDVYSYEFLAYKSLIDQEAKDENLPDYFVNSDSVSPEQHVEVQAAAQKWVDSSISKTINVPSDIDYSAFKEIYLHAHAKGLKGCTTFRFNPEAFQGVLVRNEDLESTRYEFILENGEKITCKGSDEIEYEGETHTAANLYDAIKEGYYGKIA